MQVDEQAAWWSVELGDNPVSIETLRAFRTWRDANPEHARVFREIEIAWREAVRILRHARPEDWRPEDWLSGDGR